jgi:hypothetical protein
VCSNGKDEEGELLLRVGIRVRGRMPKKKTVLSSITSMGFPLLRIMSLLVERVSTCILSQNPSLTMLTFCGNTVHTERISREC